MLGYATISNHDPSALVPSRGIFSGMGLIRYRSPPVFRVTTPRHTPLRVFRATTSGYTPLRVFRDSNPGYVVVSVLASCTLLMFVPSKGIFSGWGTIRYRSPSVFWVTTPRYTPLQVFRAATSGYTPLRVFRDSNPRHLISRLVDLVVDVGLWMLRWLRWLRWLWTLRWLRWWLRWR